MSVGLALTASLASAQVAAPLVGQSPVGIAAPVRVGVVEDRANGRYGFSPSPVVVRVGDTILFVNDGAEAHDFLSIDGEAFGSEPIEPGGTFAHTFAQAGSVRLICDLHADMEARIEVRG